MTAVGQIRYQLFQLNRQAEAKCAEIGSKVYDLASNGRGEVKLTEPLRKLIASTQVIERQIKTLETKAEKLSR